MSDQELVSAYARVRLVVEFRVQEFSDACSVRDFYARARQAAVRQSRSLPSVLDGQWEGCKLIGEPVVELVLVPESGKTFAPSVEVAPKEGSDG